MVPKFLYHYFEKERGPFKNLTQNGYKKAQEIQENITLGFNNNRPHNYIDLRFSAERRLKEGFVAKGGRPNRNDPFYFTLGPSSWMQSCYHNPDFVKISLDKIKSEHISFTYPDGMVSFQFYDEPKLKMYRKDCNGEVFLLKEITQVIEKYGLPSEDKWSNYEEQKYDRYIEAQVWDEEMITIIQNSQ